MNAVNLAPAGSDKRLRSRQKSKPKVAFSPPTITLLGVLLVALVGTFVFVSAHQRVASRRTTLAQVQNGVTAWAAAADGFSGSVAQSTQREQSIAGVRQLIADRYHWSVLLTQLAGLIPADVQLNSVQASTPSATAAGNAGIADGVSVQGCAASQTAVAHAMVALHRVNGIANVTLASSAKQDDASSGAAGGDSAGASTGSSVCALPVQFQITLVFATSAPAGATPAASAVADTGSSTGMAQ